MEKIIRVGKMPGRISEVVVETGATVQDVLAVAELSAEGFDIKVNGQLGNLTDVVGTDTELIILSQRVKGNK